MGIVTGNLQNMLHATRSGQAASRIEVDTVTTRELRIVNDDGQVVGRFAAGRGDDEGVYLNIGSADMPNITLASVGVMGERSALVRMTNSHAVQEEKKADAMLALRVGGTSAGFTMYSKSSDTRALSLNCDAAAKKEPMTYKVNGESAPIAQRPK